MDLFAQMEKQQRRTPFEESTEHRFFLEHSGILADIPYFSKFSRADVPFDIIRANIIIRALQNKAAIENAFIKLYKSSQKDSSEEAVERIVLATAKASEKLPYYQLNDRRIFVPILPKSLNEIYDGDYYKLIEKPYNKLLRKYEAVVVDPFDTYGPELYNSYFTKLIRIGSSGGRVAFYDYDSYSAYVINEEGRLEVKMSFFDKYLKKKNVNHMMERVGPAIDAFFQSDKEKFLEILVEKELISSRFIYKNKYLEEKLNKKLGI